ncbi:glycosyltransferase family 4 protein [Magnetofaba australis]|nr:glycosyltransferase family 4 protein [Magnetofaba australis]
MTQFAPPCDHGVSEEEYLRYDDWFAKLRRHLAKSHRVTFLSQTKQKSLIRIPWEGYEALFFPIDNPNEKQKAGIRYHSAALLDWFEQEKPDVLHVIGSQSAMGLQLLESPAAGVKILWERNHTTPQTLAWPGWKHAQRYLHCTQESAELAAAEVPRERLDVVPMVSDPSKFHPMEDVARAYDILSVGKLTGRKQFNVVRDLALAENLRWLHVGGFVKGPPYPRWKDLFYSRQMRALGLAGPIKSAHGCATGVVSHDQMPRIYNQARLLVHPSNNEGASRAMLEALGSGMPVVANRQGAPWVQPEFGIVLDDLASFRPTVAKLLADPDRLNAMGRAGREWVQHHCAPERLFETIDALHAQLGLTF